MNTNTYAVVTSQNGSLPSVISKNSPDWYDYQRAGYETLFEGTRRAAYSHLEALMGELVDCNFFEA